MNIRAATAALLLPDNRREEMEFRYAPRPGPIISPEPEFHDVEQSKELFDVDPDTTLLVSAQESIEDITKDMQNHMLSEFNRISHVVYAEILVARRPIKGQDFQELTQKCIEGLTEVTNNYCTTMFTPQVVNLLDTLLASMRESLVVCKKKIAQKLINIRDTMADHRRTLQLSFDHDKSEAIRIARNESRREFLQELTDLRENAEKIDFGNRVLTKKIHSLSAELISKDAQISLLEAKSEKALKKARELQIEAVRAKKLAENELAELKHSLLSQSPHKSDSLGHTAHSPTITTTSPSSIVHGKRLYVDSFTQTVDNFARGSTITAEKAETHVDTRQHLTKEEPSGPNQTIDKEGFGLHSGGSHIHKELCKSCVNLEEQIKVLYTEYL
jgi:hypothetical protein